MRAWGKLKRPHPKQAVFNDKGFVGYRQKYGYDARGTVRKTVVDDRGQIFAKMANGQLVNTGAIAKPEDVARLRADRKKARATQPTPKQAEKKIAGQMLKNIWGKIFLKGKAKR